jgi:hypothetical protein
MSFGKWKHQLDMIGAGAGFWLLLALVSLFFSTDSTVERVVILVVAVVCIERIRNYLRQRKT